MRNGKQQRSFTERITSEMARDITHGFVNYDMHGTLKGVGTFFLVCGGRKSDDTHSSLKIKTLRTPPVKAVGCHGRPLVGCVDDASTMIASHQTNINNINSVICKSEQRGNSSYVFRCWFNTTKRIVN